MYCLVRMVLFLVISFGASSSDLSYNNRIYFLAINYNVSNFICPSGSIHKERKIRKGAIFLKEVVFSDFLGLVRFKRLSDYLNFVPFILIRFLIIVIEIKAFILISSGTLSIFSSWCRSRKHLFHRSR